MINIVIKVEEERREGLTKTKTPAQKYIKLLTFSW